jgi:hypothetical protein
MPIYYQYETQQFPIPKLKLFSFLHHLVCKLGTYATPEICFFLFYYKPHLTNRDIHELGF